MIKRVLTFIRDAIFVSIVIIAVIVAATYLGALFDIYLEVSP